MASFQEILSELTSADASRRSFTLDRVGELAPEDALQILTPFLQDSNEDIRGTAAFNLGVIHDPRAIPY